MNGALPEDVGQLAHVQTIHSIGFPCVRLHSPFKTQGNRKTPLPVSQGTGSLRFLPPPAGRTNSSKVFVGCLGSDVPKRQSHTTNSYLLATSYQGSPPTLSLAWGWWDLASEFTVGLGATPPGLPGQERSER